MAAPAASPPQHPRAPGALAPRIRSLPSHFSSGFVEFMGPFLEVGADGLGIVDCVVLQGAELMGKYDQRTQGRGIWARAGGRGLGTFESGLKGGVRIVKAEEAEGLANHDICIQYFSLIEAHLDLVANFVHLMLGSEPSYM
ncbi:hypothetical protein C2845_PM13G07940 [Panicum miliaceum]|uniref:Uncharacterized protein n=1 Tax=Panicum miliaceum TaxID=4540 RepID=A0A3L6RHL4_PANMI|nr:hypothetical protein C2845_PM13G07940 [Panicum miliaceum]